MTNEWKKLCISSRAETIPRVTRIQKNPRRKLCASKNRLVHFTRDAQNFRPPKIYTLLQPSSLAPRDAPFNIPFYQCAFCSFTGKAESAQITHRQEICTILVPVCSSVTVLWHAVVQMYWATLVKSPSLICSPLCSHALIITALPGFLYFCTFTWCFFTQNHNFYYFPIDLRDMMSINSYYAIISLYEWMAEARVFLYHTHTHTHWSARGARGDLVCRLNEDINTHTTSPELIWESLHQRFTVSYE